MPPAKQAQTHLPDNAFQLLRRIPYFGPDPPCLMQGTAPTHWPDFYLKALNYNPSKKDRRRHRREAREAAEFLTEDEKVPRPPHIVTLASGGRYSYTILIDTERGTVIWWIDMLPWVRGAPKGDVEPMEPGAGDWRGMPTFRIRTFFDMCREQFLTMVRVTTGNINVLSRAYGS